VWSAAAVGSSRVRKRSAAKARTVRAPATSYTVEAAANLLSLDPTALRARLCRAQRNEGPAVVADLGGGFPASNWAKAGAFGFRSPEAMAALSIARRCAMLRNVTHEQAPMAGKPWES
jgi:hypothetical protein